MIRGPWGRPKNDRDRVVDLPQRAVAILRQHKHLRGPFVFCREDGSLLPRWVCESKSKEQRHDSPLMKVCRRAGLRRVGWHVQRHTYASHLVMRGASLVEVKDLLGHASIEMTMRYAHLSPNARKSAVALLDRRPQPGERGYRRGRCHQEPGLGRSNAKNLAEAHRNRTCPGCSSHPTPVLKTGDSTSTSSASKRRSKRRSGNYSASSGMQGVQLGRPMGSSKTWSNFERAFCEKMKFELAPWLPNTPVGRGRKL